MRIVVAAFLTIGLWASACRAEDPVDPSKEGKPKNAVNLYGGRMLPYGVYGVRDLYPFWGFRYGRQVWELDPEFSMYFINSKNVNFYSAALSFTFPDKLEGWTYIPFFGLDAHYYSGRTTTSKLAYKPTMGFHLGVSPVIEFSSNFAVRADFKFNFGPGWILFVGTGFSIMF